MAELIRAGVDGPAFVRGLVPRPLEGSAALLAVGIIGATVMPHALHFHSAMSREDSRPEEAAKLAAAARARKAIAVAMSFAALANVSLVLIAARLPAEAAGGLEEAYAAIGDVLGSVAAVGFGLALLASGLSSTIVGIYTGQIVMQGFWARPISLWLRRLLAVIPPLVILIAGVDPTTALVLSQVVLSFGSAGQPAAAGAAHLAPRGDGSAGERPGHDRGRRVGHRRDHRAGRLPAGGPVRRLSGRAVATTGQRRAVTIMKPPGRATPVPSKWGSKAAASATRT